MAIMCTDKDTVMKPVLWACIREAVMALCHSRLRSLKAHLDMDNVPGDRAPSR